MSSALFTLACAKRPLRRPKFVVCRLIRSQPAALSRLLSFSTFPRFFFRDGHCARCLQHDLSIRMNCRKLIPLPSVLARISAGTSSRAQDSLHYQAVQQSADMSGHAVSHGAARRSGPGARHTHIEGRASASANGDARAAEAVRFSDLDSGDTSGEPQDPAVASAPRTSPDRGRVSAHLSQHTLFTDEAAESSDAPLLPPSSGARRAAETSGGGGDASAAPSEDAVRRSWWGFVQLPVIWLVRLTMPEVGMGDEVRSQPCLPSLHGMHTRSVAFRLHACSPARLHACSVARLCARTRTAWRRGTPLTFPPISPGGRTRLHTQSKWWCLQMRVT